MVQCFFCETEVQQTGTFFVLQANFKKNHLKACNLNASIRLVYRHLCFQKSTALVILCHIHCTCTVQISCSILLCDCSQIWTPFNSINLKMLSLSGNLTVGYIFDRDCIELTNIEWLMNIRLSLIHI